MPPHDETARVGTAGSVRRPPPARASSAGSSGSAGARRPAVSGRARTSASRDGGRPPARSGGGGGGRPPAKPPTGGGRSGGSGPGRPPGGGGKKKNRTAKQKRRRWYKIIAGTGLSLLLMLGVFVGVVYASTDVPSPDSITNQQTTIVYYSDGVTEMARLSGGENRIEVGLDQISEPAREAVLAAENRNFYNDPGISFTGIVRAAWNNLTGGSTQGGSTITQQYVKNAFLSSDQTFSRKFKELFLAIKLDNEYSKDEILENYLNTIYFGRGAYGIEAAANTYFGVKAADLTPEQGAVLAVLVRSPSYYDPANNPEEAQDRWGKVLDAMVEQGWVESAARQAMVYPGVLPNTGTNMGIPSGPEGFIVQQALAEVTADGYDDVEASGLRITTTVNKGYQDAAVAAVNDVMQGEDPALRQALVSVDPKTGGVVAYYGNAQSSSPDPANPLDTTDYAQALKPPGSSFKPFTLATALENGFSVDTKRDGSSPQEFPDRPGLPVSNASNAQCASCTLKEAITKSLNTTFYGLAYDVGPAKVAELARAASGIPASWPTDNSIPEALRGQPSLTSPDNQQTGGSIGIGEYAVRPINQAVGFATFAAGGVYHPAHFVASIADSTGAVLKTIDGSQGAQQVVPADVASDVTFAMEDVAAYSKRSLDGNRPVASKTGTQGLNKTDNSDAWMVGYTPSISTAVWMGTQGASPITNAQGKIIYGSGLPGAIWQEYMDSVLAGTPEEPLPSKALIKGDESKSNVAEETTEAPATSSESSQTTSQAPATSSSAAPTTTATTPPATSSSPVVPPVDTTTLQPSTAGGRPTFGIPGPGQPDD